MFVRVVYVCMLLRQNTNLVEHKHCEPETDFATVLNILSLKCILTLFVLFSGHFHDVRGR